MKQLKGPHAAFGNLLMDLTLNAYQRAGKIPRVFRLDNNAIG